MDTDSDREWVLMDTDSDREWVLMDTADRYRAPPPAKQSHISTPKPDMAAYISPADDRHGLLLEAIADFEKAVASLNRCLTLLRAYRDVEQARRIA